MNEIKIETSQNVALFYEPASIKARALAVIVDYVIIACIIFLITISGVFETLSFAFQMLLILIISAYDLLFELFANGQSPGKMVKNIKVVKIDGSSPDFISYFLRWIFRLIEGLSFWGVPAIICISMNGRGQRIGDIAANTCVIQIRENAELDDLTYTRVANNYQLVFPEVKCLSDDDINILKEILERVSQSNDTNLNRNLLYKTKSKISTKMGITSEMESRKFIETVINDHCYILTKMDAG